MKKILSIVIFILLSVIYITGCSSKTVNQTKESKSSTKLLFDSIRNSDINTAMKILKENPNEKFVDENGNSALTVALSNYGFKDTYGEVTNELLNRTSKEDINKKNKDGETPIVLAFQNFPSASYKEEIIKKIIDKGADIKTKDSNGNTLLMLSIMTKDVNLTNITKMLMDNKEIDLNAKNKYGDSALTLAIKNLNPDDYIKGSGVREKLVRDLIENGADINTKDGDGNNLLMLQVLIYSKVKDTPTFAQDNIEYLLDKGVKINEQNNKGETALLISASYGGHCPLLIDKGANINIKDKQGNTYEKVLKEWKASYKPKNSYTNNYNNYSTNTEPKLGMTSDEVRNSTWGSPKDINRTTTKYGVIEQWIYSDDRYVYLEDGKVTAIQE